VTPLQFFIIILVILVFTIGYLQWIEAVTPDELIWVGGDKGIRQVSIYYVDNIFVCSFETLGYEIKGCYRGNFDHIELRKDSVNNWATQGCTVKQHEILHAWGIGHGTEMAKFNCDNPNEPDYNKYQFNSTNITHKDLTDDHRVVFEPDPRMIIWR